MKEGKILDYLKPKKQEPIKIPYNSSNSVDRSGQDYIKSNPMTKKSKKNKPRKFTVHKSTLSSTYHCHSDYLMLKNRERMRQRQVDWIDGKIRGFKLMSMSGDITKDYEKQLYTKKQVVRELAQNLSSQVKRNKRDSNIKSVDDESGFKPSIEFFSGKKLSTTASRSPKSDWEEKKNCEELHKNMSDIRSYFMGNQDYKIDTQGQVFEIKREKKSLKQE